MQHSCISAFGHDWAQLPCGRQVAGSLFFLRHFRYPDTVRRASCVSINAISFPVLRCQTSSGPASSTPWLHHNNGFVLSVLKVGYAFFCGMGFADELSYSRKQGLPGVHILSRSNLSYVPGKTSTKPPTLPRQTPKDSLQRNCQVRAKMCRLRGNC